MSAQVVAALRKRADQLEIHSRALRETGDEQDVILANGRWVPGRSARFCQLLATEYRLLADTAEGRS